MFDKCRKLIMPTASSAAVACLLAASVALFIVRHRRRRLSLLAREPLATPGWAERYLNPAAAAASASASCSSDAMW